MPAYHRTEGLTRVAPAFRGKPVLSAEQIEDVVAFLMTLKRLNDHAHPSRREFLRAAGGVAAVLGVGAGHPGDAGPARPRRDAGRHPQGGRRGAASATGRVKLELPPLVENGNTVPLTVSVESPMTRPIT